MRESLCVSQAMNTLCMCPPNPARQHAAYLAPLTTPQEAFAAKIVTLVGASHYKYCCHLL